MLNQENNKVTVSHLQRNAYLYIRQSSMHQVYEHKESTKRQYALAERAIALGWPMEKVITIDNDLGLSGAQASNRDGFKKLVAEVSMGNAGIVIGIEVSRLARNSSDWHRLLEICALSETLILDEDGLYNPKSFNDRLLLGMKGTMSEAELHYLKARMWGGRLAKAKRGELKMPLPVGFVHGEDGKVHMDPDIRVQDAIKAVFETFRKKRTAHGVMKFFKEHDIKFPTVMLRGPYKGQTVWSDIIYTRVLQVLRNPRYAGVFSYGRLKTRKTVEGVTKYINTPQAKLYAYIKDAHPGYISHEEYEENQKILSQNAHAYGTFRRKGPPREGSALLQGIILCGKCGRRMHVQYRVRGKKVTGAYLCSTYQITHGNGCCQTISGRVIDESVSNLLLESLTPQAANMVFQIQEELKQRSEQVDKIQKQHIERLEYEANIAKSRYMQVDPDNRLVACTLESEWNKKLRALKEAHEEYEKKSIINKYNLSQQEREELVALVNDFPSLWNNPKTSNKDKKRILRYLIEDVTITRAEDMMIFVQIRFKGGATKTLHIPAPKPATELFKTSKKTIDKIDNLLNDYHDSGVAKILNAEGHKTPRGLEYKSTSIGGIRRKYGLKSFYERLRKQNEYTIWGLANKLGVHYNAIYSLIKKEIIKAYRHQGRKAYVCEFNPDVITRKLKEDYESGRTTKSFYDKIMNCIREVQYEF